MQNVVGQIAKGDNFFPRPNVIEEIYDRLDAGAHLFLSAPRRVGKTSIMRHLEDNPRESYTFIFQTTEAVEHSEEFYKRLIRAISSSSVITGKNYLLSNSKKLLDDLSERFKKIKISQVEVEFKEPITRDLEEAFEQLIANLNTTKGQIILMIDEFPQTIENISRRYGREEAARFLRVHRQIRQKASNNIQFIFTGSIGLDAVVKKMDDLKLINDLNRMSVYPLSSKESTDFLWALFRKYNLTPELDVFPVILERVRWLIPYYLQLMFQEIKDLAKSQGSNRVKPDMVEKSFQSICHRRDDTTFRPMYDRLAKIFEGKSRYFSLSLLKHLSSVEDMSRNEIKSLAHQYEVPHEYDVIVNALVYDGYIDNQENEDRFRFNSPMLQLWWKRFTAHKSYT